MRKSFNAGRYSGYAVAKYYRSKIEDGFTSEEAERLETLRDEIYKERCRRSDVLREYNKLLRNQSRFEALLDVLKTEIKTLAPIEMTRCLPIKNKKRVYAVAQLSDWHCGKIIKNDWNVFNNDVLVKRAETIMLKIIQKSKLNGVTDLIVEINGDMLDGVINCSDRNVEEADVISQTVFISELLAQVINTLRPNYETIRVVTTLGNHGRIFSDKKKGATKENFEMFIPEFLKLRLNNSIDIITSNGNDFTSYEIDGELICVAHGQHDKLLTAISDFSKMYKRVPKEIHLGHYHTYQDMNDCDIYVTVNGCLDGADDYSINNCRKVNKPSQNLIIYDDDRCIYQLCVD